MEKCTNLLGEIPEKVAIKRVQLQAAMKMKCISAIRSNRQEK